MFETLLLNFIAKHYHDAAHSIFSPSGSHMWMNCPGSLIPNLLALDQAGYDAALGTVAHSVHEEWLLTGEKPLHMLGHVEKVREGTEVFEIEIDREMFDFVQESVDRLINLPGKHYIEKKVYFSRLTPIDHQGGTADFFACQPRKLIIRDYKHGKGVWVGAEDNSQALLYALGVFYAWDHEYNFQEIDIGIHQPRLDNFDYWTISRKDLLKFAKRVKATSHDAWRLGAPLSPSEKACKFCKVKANCPAYAKLAEDIDAEAWSDLLDPIEADRVADTIDTVGTGLFDPSFKHPQMLHTRHLAKLLPYRSMFETWFAAVETELEARAGAGEKVEGHKLVEARTHRVLADTKKAIRRMAEAGVDEFELYKLSMLSPAQMEDLLREKGMKKKDAVEFLKDVVSKPPGKPTLVPESDKRPAFTPADEGVWNDL